MKLMTYAELKQSDKEVLTPSDVAELLGVMPNSINRQAKEDVRQLGFPACLIGTRVRIPRIGFINWFEGRNA